MEEASIHCAAGIGIWEWASNDKGCEPDIIMVSAGDVPTLEALAATSILRTKLPHLKIRFVNVVNLMKLVSPSEHPHGLTHSAFDSIFTREKPVIFAFHAFPNMVEKLIFGRCNRNFSIHEFKEEGTISTAFDITVLNSLDRFHLVIDVCDKVQNECNNVDATTKWSASYLKQEMEITILNVSYILKLKMFYMS